MQQTEPQDSERPRFTVIHHAVMIQLDITANEYLVLDTVYHLSAKHGYCYKSMRAMATDLNITTMGISKIVNRLESRGLLQRSAAGLMCGAAYVNVAYLEPSPSVNKVVTRKQSLQAQRKQSLQSVNKVDERKQSTTKKYSLDIQEVHSLVDPKDQRPSGPTLKDLFYKLNTELQGTAAVKATDSRLRKLKARLKTYKPAELMIAAKAIGQDDYMQGDSERNADGKRYGTIDYLVRNDDNVAKWIEAATVDRQQNRKVADWAVE